MVENGKTHDGALADRGTAVELVLTCQRYPRFVLLLIAMLAELTLAPFTSGPVLS
jgi:hypothetical protein